MEIVVGAVVASVTVGIAYVLRFARATLYLGRLLAETDSGTCYQDAITPPWLAKVSIAVYIAVVLSVCATWWLYDWRYAIGSTGVLLIGSMLVMPFLPKPNGEHYQGLIIQSMLSRYADYVSAGDELRAEAMNSLLAKTGIDIESI